MGGIVCDVESKECAHDECQQTHEITPGGENVGEFVYQQWVLKNNNNIIIIIIIIFILYSAKSIQFKALHT